MPQQFSTSGFQWDDEAEYSTATLDSISSIEGSVEDFVRIAIVLFKRLQLAPRLLHQNQSLLVLAYGEGGWYTLNHCFEQSLPSIIVLNYCLE